MERTRLGLLLPALALQNNELNGGSLQQASASMFTSFARPGMGWEPWHLLSLTVPIAVGYLSEGSFEFDPVVKAQVVLGGSVIWADEATVKTHLVEEFDFQGHPMFLYTGQGLISADRINPIELGPADQPTFSISSAGPHIRQFRLSVNGGVPVNFLIEPTKVPPVSSPGSWSVAFDPRPKFGRR